MKKLSEVAKVRLIILGIFVIAILAAFFDAPTYFDKGADWLNAKFDKVSVLSKINVPHFYSMPFRLGLDLQGGSHLVYRADVSQIPIKDQTDALESVRDVIEKRVNAFGVAEPIVQTSKTQGEWRVLVELAGVRDIAQAIKMIGETPLLEFKEQNTEPARDMTEQEKKEMTDYNNGQKSKAQEVLNKLLKGGNWNDLVKQYSEDSMTKDNGGDLGYLNSKSANNDLYLKIKDADESKKLVIGKVFNSIVELNGSYDVIKVDEKKEGDPEVEASHILICYKDAQSCTQERTKEEAKKIIDDIRAKATPQNFGQLAKENSDEGLAKTSSGDLGWFSKGMMVQAFEDKAFSMEKGTISDVIETPFGYHIIYLKDKRATYEYKTSRILFYIKTKSDYVPAAEPWKYTGLTGKQFNKAQVAFDPNTGEPYVQLDFNDEGKTLFADITKRNVGKPLAIFLDKKAIVDANGDGEISPDEVYAPNVNEAILDGKAIITGSFSIDEAKTLAKRLNAGALPVPIELINQQTVGASLGKDSLQKSLMAGLWGLLAVSIFMIGYYRSKGLVAVLALLIYTSFVLALFKLFTITLTLAGIAGFILSIGMAVDANVLIFERIKEEKRAGRAGMAMIDEGFKRAWLAIRDCNVTTIITCAILFYFGTSVIRGFALTLGLGVLMSMFTAITVSRLLLKSFLVGKSNK